ncbi:MAG: 23S rRNA (pseudouridine(1915)-N(3))-methyltransferase RlmH [Gammaproteobacteria bacterium]|nr:23S rRNA (pseudouridine(1915)-N(3))-methyltransferase RlmH [Gammaproteobacteria bacterium]MCW5582660.1 23S rRNA (pseudouridine(1915)-N(3))-methyltransferase RlmH [Gammaproteobacteria bacterium]
MKIRLLTITHKSPAWIREGYAEYIKRLPSSCSLELIEIPAEKRLANADIKRITEREGEKMLHVIKPHHHIIALDVRGKLWSTEQLADQLAEWHHNGRNVDLLVGGPDGLSTECLQKAEQTWSLSPLTFPHILVRLILAEQIYRAWSILNHHPYHR